MIERTTWFQLQPLYQYIRQQSENKHFLKYVEIGSTFFLIAIFLFFAIMPTATAISSLIGEIKSKEILSSSMSSKISDIMQAQESFSQVQENYSVIESSYPSLPKFNQSASTISYVSKQSSTPIRQLRFQLNNKDNQTSNSDTFSVNLTTSGTYRSILNSIEGLSNVRRLVNIKSVQISQIDENQIGSNQLNLTINADLYYLSANNDKK